MVIPPSSVCVLMGEFLQRPSHVLNLTRQHTDDSCQYGNTPGSFTGSTPAYADDSAG